MTALIFLVPGLLLGFWHFGSLRWLSRRWIEAGSTRWLSLLGLQLVRLGVLGAAFFWTVRQGAPALLALALGVLIARVIVVRRSQPRPGHQP